MRTIQKNSPPDLLVEWIAKYKDDPNFGYDLLRQAKDVIGAVTDSLIDEQGGLCAYTGKRITEESCHIEHLKPQAYCDPGEEVDYNNLVACYPRPNSNRVPFGAHAKDNWPSPAEERLFVSPLKPRCERRFRFNRRGVISHPEGDIQAATTIQKLRLCHDELTARRKEAIDGARNPRNKGYLSKAQLKKVVAKLESETGPYRPYCFAIKQGLEECMRKAS